ncbi:transposase IstA domain protein [Mycobacterium kansasii]|uniref:Transposase IstA domain protein n=1 Tax=Mycobacterium kansasii TaxID=1768 RepID=A0A1V3X4W3_MYCKA|nr:transposase IstA domain protein [Mycobacterium kansasii]
MEVHALRKRGWTISAIARHTGFDRKTVRKYLDGDGTPGCVPDRVRIRSIRSSTTSPRG